MEALRLVLRYAHLVGFALLLGGAVMQTVREFRINPAMPWGAIIQVLTGVGLARRCAVAATPNRIRSSWASSSLIAILILVMVFVPRKRPEINKGHFIGIIVLTLVNAAVAVFWR